MRTCAGYSGASGENSAIDEPGDASFVVEFYVSVMMVLARQPRCAVDFGTVMTPRLAVEVAVRPESKRCVSEQRLWFLVVVCSHSTFF